MGSGCNHLADHKGAYLLLIRKFTLPFPYTLPLSMGVSGALHTTQQCHYRMVSCQFLLSPTRLKPFPSSPASVGPSLSLPISHCTALSGLAPIHTLLRSLQPHLGPFSTIPERNTIQTGKLPGSHP